VGKFTSALLRKFQSALTETNDGGENDLVGGELTYSVLPGFLGGVSLK
jgi:hypothetical protein